MRGLLLTITALLALTAKAPAMEGPWSVSDASPALDVSTSYEQSTHEGTLGANVFIVLIEGFRNYISPVDGDRCNMYPTCSTYGIDAFRKHGALRGLMLTADRLLHEYDEALFAPLMMKHGRVRYYDPVEYNDFWWHE